MPETFTYKVRDKAGKLVEGQLEAENAQLVVSKLRSMGYVPIEIEQQSGNNLSREIKIPFFSDRIKLKDVSVFSRQFATMINSGLSMLRSLVHPRRADREQAARRDRQPGSPRRRARRVALGRAREAPEGVQPPVRRDGARRRGRRCARQRAAAPRDDDREAGRAAPQGEVGDDLSRSSCRASCCCWSPRCCCSSSRCSRTSTSQLGGKLPVPTQILIDVSNVVRKLWFIVFGGEIAARVGVPPLDQLRRGPQALGRDQAEDAGVRPPRAQDGARPVRPHALGAGAFGRADPRVARHRVRDVGQLRRLGGGARHRSNR